jgi:uncharacterized protein (DUF58 family)
MHRSPFKGYSVEFAQHRGYVPGDDLKHLDWKVWGKNERYYIKQYEAETNLVCTVLCDTSTSMRYKGSKAHKQLSKLAWAQLATAALTYLIVNQSDSIGVATFADGLGEWIPPSSRKVHLLRICDVLEKTKNQKRTSIGDALSEVARRVQRRGIIIVISDFLDDLGPIAKGLGALRHRGHEVAAIQVMDPDELTFPFEGMIQFRGLEASAEALCHPRSIRKAYLEELEKHQTAVRAACRRNNIDYVFADTAHGVDVVLAAYLARREHAAAAGGR